MIFMREQRPHVEEKIRRMGNGIVNTVLGQRVRVTVSVTNLINAWTSRH